MLRHGFEEGTKILRIAVHTKFILNISSESTNKPLRTTVFWTRSPKYFVFECPLRQHQKTQKESAEIDNVPSLKETTGYQALSRKL